MTGIFKKRTLLASIDVSLETEKKFIEFYFEDIVENGEQLPQNFKGVVVAKVFKNGVEGKST